MTVLGFPAVVIPAGTPLFHATRASFLGLPSSPRGDRPAWFGLGEEETRWYAQSSWGQTSGHGGTGPARIIEAVATRELVLPNVTGDYRSFAGALGTTVVTPEALFAALRARGLCGWAIASKTLGLNEQSAIALVDPERCGVRFLRSSMLSGLWG